MKKIKSSILIRFFGIILFIYILTKIDTAELIAAFKEINLVYYLIGILFFILGFLIRILKWKILVNSIGAEISFKVISKISTQGVFFGSITPGKLGEFWRAKYLAKETGVTGGKALYTTFIDRVVDLLVVVVISLVGMVVIYLKLSKTQNWPLLVAFILLLFIVFTCFFIRKKGIQKLCGTLIRFLIPSSLKEKTDSFLNEFYQGFKNLNLSLFLTILALGFLYYFLIGPIFYYFITLALGISLPFWYLFLIIAMAWLVAIIPVTILGLGTREATFIYFFSLFGILAPFAVAFSLLGLLCNILIIALPGAILFLRQK